MDNAQFPGGNRVPKALTIAGSDSGGGAGIQADLKTFQELGAYGMSVLTAVTAQNTLGVRHIAPLPVESVVAQLEAVAEDLPPDAVKTGMLADGELIAAIADAIRRHEWRNVVIDPVMTAKGGGRLLETGAVDALIRELLPLADVVTPNLPEAESLVGFPIRTMQDRFAVCRRLVEFGAKHVVLKGGHDPNGSHVSDLLYDGNRFTAFIGERIDTKHTHGTGCTFASAIAAELAKGASVSEAVLTAKRFIQAAVATPLCIGGGHGPTNHWAYRLHAAAAGRDSVQIVEVAP